ncbi:amidase family protein [Mesoplasma lactucae]|uniref:Asp-tRNA(Asn)/Glu-tRNA(Gln) amidotransferase GatCAB subunit A n=1 Tax=Mesoplasma lactucae ATCC 49193 TaxID=81460 RepID=A0A291IS34_9MOLU|nr:amidase family protein [Mesoplasma lactucae]ATG97609.1 Asp-tRNA(Asn)/Glu-tRNA(Gln) amidotransferase GatCAB subunit A [Mesoplasma lactucae ATCC 49193]ATZ19930.1 aspartyl/glutamyl-tRNA amidotransferase subunit A [Mesoplasma lactucae ATCC 49193]MCL8216794.1 Glutamyl-tRNA(Gln) amidotransferase subunit A [Mesoplasma lactucae ATCC 49193]
MSIKNKTILELHDELVNHKTTAKKLVEELLVEIELTKHDHVLISHDKKDMLYQAELIDAKGINPEDLLMGIPYFAKDNFATKNLQTTAGSKILEGFVPLYNANVIDLLDESGAIMSGKSNMDELGMGGTGLSSGYGLLHNPLDHERLVGGSSSGSAFAVAKGMVPFALGTDTGDSIRKPASFVGIVGYKPTYGAISRYGMFPYSPSLDHGGVLTRTVDDAAIVADALIKKDFRDFTSVEIAEKDFYKNINNFDKNQTFGYIKDVHDHLPKELREKYNELYKMMEKDGVKVVPIEFRSDLLNALSSVYMMISFSEAVSSNANLTGVDFGDRVDGETWEDIMKDTRTNKFGPVVKRRFIIGSLNLQKENQNIYLHKAKKVRRLICDELEKAYKQVDFLITPPSQTIAPLIVESEEIDQNKNKETEYIDDILTLGNFSGMPSITIPFVTAEKMPVGLNLNAKPFADLKVLQGAKYLENLMDGMEREIFK